MRRERNLLSVTENCRGPVDDDRHDSYDGKRTQLKAPSLLAKCFCCRGLWPALKQTSLIHKSLAHLCVCLPMVTPTVVPNASLCVIAFLSSRICPTNTPAKTTRLIRSVLLDRHFVQLIKLRYRFDFYGARHSKIGWPCSSTTNTRFDLQKSPALLNSAARHLA
jgi:hypothetical protein